MYEANDSTLFLRRLVPPVLALPDFFAGVFGMMKDTVERGKWERGAIIKKG